MASDVALGPHYENYLQEQVASGRYRDTSDVLRSALRLLESEEELKALKLAELQHAVQLGAESGSGTSADAVFERLEKKYEALVRSQA